MKNRRFLSFRVDHSRYENEAYINGNANYNTTASVFNTTSVMHGRIKYITGGVFKPYVHHRRAFAIHASDGHITSKSVLVKARVIMEVIVEPKRPSAAVNTCVSPCTPVSCLAPVVRFTMYASKLPGTGDAFHHVRQ